MWHMHVRMGGSLVLVAGLGLLVWWESRRRNRRRLQVPTQWRQVGKLASLTVFPLKSGRGIPLKEGECTEIGLRALGQGAAHLRDRFFVIYGDKFFDHKNAKTYPKMVLINISSEKEGEVTFEAPGMPALKLQVPDHANKINDKYCLLWLNDKVKTFDCGEEVASWMSRYILDKESGVRLGYHLEHVTQRNAYKPPWSAFRVFYDKLRTKDIGAYSDLASYMLMSESTVAELDGRLPESARGIGTLQFRPNLVVQGSQPYEEDTWDWIRVGDTAIFRNIKPCVRCTIITVDPETGVMQTEREPFKTLKGYRIVTNPRAKKIDGDNPAMGVYIGLHVPGVIKTGDFVYVNCT